MDDLTLQGLDEDLHATDGGTAYICGRLGISRRRRESGWCLRAVTRQGCGSIGMHGNSGFAGWTLCGSLTQRVFVAEGAMPSVSGAVARRRGTR